MTMAKTGNLWCPTCGDPNVSDGLFDVSEMSVDVLGLRGNVGLEQPCPRCKAVVRKYEVVHDPAQLAPATDSLYPG